MCITGVQLNGDVMLHRYIDSDENPVCAFGRTRLQGRLAVTGHYSLLRY